MLVIKDIEGLHITLLISDHQVSAAQRGNRIICHIYNIIRHILLFCDKKDSSRLKKLSSQKLIVTKFMTASNKNINANQLNGDGNPWPGII